MVTVETMPLIEPPQLLLTNSATVRLAMGGVSSNGTALSVLTVLSVITASIADTDDIKNYDNTDC